MPFKKAIRFCGVYLLAATMLWVPTVTQAEMLSTQETLQSLTNNAEKREWLTSMVLREEVQGTFAGVRCVPGRINEPRQ